MNRRDISMALVAGMAMGAHAQLSAPTSLVDAAGRGDLAQVRRLLDAGAPIGQRDARGRRCSRR
jgi:hypothetical protein